MQRVAAAAEPLALMRVLVLRQPRDAENGIALGNTGVALPEPFVALRAFVQTHWLVLWNRSAAEASAGVLRGLGASYGAALQLTDVPSALRVAQAGRQVRWSTQIEPPSLARRFEPTGAALDGIDKLLAEVAATPSADPALRLPCA